MEKVYTYKHYILGLFLLWFTTLTLSAQCTFNETVTVYPSICSNGGKILVTVSNASDFGDITYGLKDASGNIVVPLANSSNLMEGLLQGDYTLILNAVCKLDPYNLVNKEIPVQVTQSTDTPPTSLQILDNSVTKVRPSLNNIASGVASFTIIGGTAPYLVKITQAPSSYTGPKFFAVNQAGLVTLENLSGTQASESYTINVSDGCNSVNLQNVTVDFVSQDVPSVLSQIGANGNIYVQSYTPAEYLEGGVYYPTSDNTTITVRFNGLDNNAIHTYLKTAALSTQYYELGLSYSTNPNTVTNWIPYNLRYASFVWQGNVKYSSILAATTPGSTVPYLFLRLKDKPEIYQMYSTYNTTTSSAAYSATTVSAGIKVTPSYTIGNRFVSTPYKIRVTNDVTGAIIEETFSVPAGSPASAYKQLPSVTIPWSTSGTTTWTFQIIGLAPGDENLLLTAATKISVGTKLAYYSPGWVTNQVYNATPCGTEFGYRHVTTKVDNNQLSYPKTVFRLISSPAGLPSSVPTTITTYAGTVTTNLIPRYTNIPLGTYRWAVDLYDENDVLVNTQTDKIMIRITDPGGVRIKNNTLTISNSPLPANVCYEYHVTIPMSQLKYITEKYIPSQNTWINGESDVQLSLYKKDPTDGLYYLASNSDVVGYNFNTTTANYISYRTLLGLLAAGTNPIFSIKTPGEYAFMAGAAYSSSYDLEDTSSLIYPVGSSGVSGSNGSYPGMNYDTPMPDDSSCGFSTKFTITQGNLSQVWTNSSMTGGFRCNASVAGELQINVETTLAANVPVEYTLTPVNAEGVATGVVIPGYQNPVLSTSRSLRLTNIPLGVEYVKVEVASSTCANYPATQIVPIYLLTSPALLSYSGGGVCQSGSVVGPADLELYATRIIETTYQWYYPDGTAIPAAYGGNTFHATVPAAEFYEGTYTCVLVNSNCTQAEYRHEIDVTGDGGQTLYWAVDAVDARWDNLDNWRTSIGEVATFLPDACTDVIIPGKVNAYYPSLESITSPECRNITFRYGGQLYYSELLKYEKAHVEYNTKYYLSVPTSNDGTLPDTNTDEGYLPESGGVSGTPLSGVKALDRNRWYMLSAPLKDMYVGDFQMNGYPYTFSALYNTATNKASTSVAKLTASDSESITMTSDNNTAILSLNNALLYWIPSYTTATGGSQDNLQATRGIINATGTSTGFDIFDIKSLSVKSTNTITRTDKSNRFIIENDSDNPGTQYNLVIPANSVGSNGLVMIGNPLMAPINLGAFYTRNSALIENEIKVLSHNGTQQIWETYSPVGSSNNVAPLQGFVIKLKNPSVSNTITFMYNELYIPVSQGFNVRVK